MTIPVYKVLHYPHALLRKKSTPVEKFTPQLEEFVKNLTSTMYEFEGGGIAAPQVGINKRIFIVDFKQVFDSNEHFEKKNDDFLVYDKNDNLIEAKFPMVFINPEFVKKEQPITTNWEGCLSVPNAESHKIERFHEVELTAFNPKGEKFKVKTTHLYASVCLLHETDHLDGLLMVDRWSKNDYSEKDVFSDVKTFEEDPTERKRIKKLKPIEATKIKFDFV